MKITFLGAARTVTGSKFLVESGGFRLLVDCGLFQGPRQWKEQNWSNFPVSPSDIDCILLTHAHIDHSGFLPRIVALGYRGPIYCTPATAELLHLMLPDSGHLQEEDAAFANKKKYTTHDPAIPLYTESDAYQSLKYLQPVDFYTETKLTAGLSFSFSRAGHILGSAMIHLQSNDHKILFTGDLGRPHQFLTKSPDPVQRVDYLIAESTYGNRLHQRIDVRQTLTEIIQTTAAAGGTILVPAFAVGRTQELLFLLRGLEETHRIPRIPVYIDSPMAIQSLSIYNRYPVDASAEFQQLNSRDSTPFIYDNVRVLRTVQESMTLNDMKYPSIIISSSGMATGGRILHHLKRRIGDHRNTVLFIGFQSEGTKGRLLVDGIQEIKIHGKHYPVRAKIEYMDALSCHVDYEEMIAWLKPAPTAPRKTFLVHGEEQASLSLAEKIRSTLGWNVETPAYLETVELS